MTNATSNLDVQNWFQTTLSASCGSGDTTFSLNSTPTPTEGYLIIDPDNTSTREVIHYTSVGAGTVTIPGAGDRGLDGGNAAQSHAQGTTVRMEFTKSHFGALKNLYAIPAGSVTATLMATASVNTAAIQPQAVTATSVNFGGSGSGIWWQEIGRTTLAATSSTISVQSLANMKYLRMEVSLLATASINAGVNFNGDAGNTYSRRFSLNGLADTTLTSTSSIVIGSDSNNDNLFGRYDILNITAQEKLLVGQTVRPNVAGAGNAPDKWETSGKWANTANAISRIDVSNSSVGFYAPNSEVIVLGHN